MHAHTQNTQQNHRHSYLTPTAKQTRTTKQQIMHAHGRRKQHSNKTRKTCEQKRQLKQAKMSKKNVCKTQQTVAQNFRDTHECSKHNKRIRKGKILATRTHMAEAKHTEIAQNLLIKEQPRKVQKKKQTQNPTQTKLI